MAQEIKVDVELAVGYPDGHWTSTWRTVKVAADAWETEINEVASCLLETELDQVKEDFTFIHVLSVDYGDASVELFSDER